MMKRTKWIAMLCAWSMMTMAVGCGSEEKTSESAAEAAAVTTEAADSETETEVSEELSESAVETEADSEEESETESSIAAEPADSDLLDTVASLGTMNYRICSDWIVSEEEDQIIYRMPDESGSIVIQRIDGNAYDTQDENEIIEDYSKRSESAFRSIPDITLLEEKWDEELLPGKKCYVLSYSYEIASVLTEYTTVFFTNFTDSEKDVFAISCTAVAETADTEAYLNEMLRTITFSS